MTTILVPQKPLEGREFEHLEENGVEASLRTCRKAHHRALFMHEIIDTRIEAARRDDRTPFYNWYVTPSICATGKTRQGNAVVVYGHVPNWLGNPDNIKRARQKGLVNDAAILPRKEFYRLLGLEDNELVYVVDYQKLKDSESGLITVKSALEHPQTIPGFGGEKRASEYLPLHQKMYNSDSIGMWHRDDLSEEPLARLLFLFDYHNGLYCDLHLDYDGRVLGVANGDAAKPHAHGKNLTSRVSGFTATDIKKLLTKTIGFTDARANAYFRELQKQR